MAETRFVRSEEVHPITRQGAMERKIQRRGCGLIVNVEE